MISTSWKQFQNCTYISKVNPPIQLWFTFVMDCIFSLHSICLTSQVSSVVVRVRDLEEEWVALKESRDFGPWSHYQHFSSRSFSVPMHLQLPKRMVSQTLEIVEGQLWWNTLNKSSQNEHTYIGLLASSSLSSAVQWNISFCIKSVPDGLSPSSPLKRDGEMRYQDVRKSSYIIK
jgi:hypothetical protein